MFPSAIRWRRNTFLCVAEKARRLEATQFTKVARCAKQKVTSGSFVVKIWLEALRHQQHCITSECFKDSSMRSQWNT